MYSSSVIFGLWVFGIAIGGGGHCDTLAYQPGMSYSWIIPPQSQPPSVSFSLSAQPQDRASANSDPSRNESPITHIGGYGHPPFYLRHSHEQLSLPNEFLITPGNPQRGDGSGGGGGGRGLSPMPIFRQLDPVDCDGSPTCTNVDITQQHQRPTTIYQSNIASVPAITPPSNYHQQRSSPPASLGQPVVWPSSHGGGIGLLFFVSESASRLPVEQLIRQQLALHRTQFPFDISINCEDAVGSGCLGPVLMGVVDFLCLCNRLHLHHLQQPHLMEGMLKMVIMQVYLLLKLTTAVADEVVGSISGSSNENGGLSVKGLFKTSSIKIGCNNNNNNLNCNKINESCQCIRNSCEPCICILTKCRFMSPSIGISNSNLHSSQTYKPIRNHPSNWDLSNLIGQQLQNISREVNIVIINIIIPRQPIDRMSKC